MNKTAVILSREEALSLPLKERPINFRISEKMYNAVFEAVGSASMCWKPPPGKEVFDPELASKIAIELCFKIAEEREDRPPTAEGVKEVKPASDRCPNCGSADFTKVHHPATFALPECWGDVCTACGTERNIG